MPDTLDHKPLDNTVGESMIVGGEAASEAVLAAVAARLCWPVQFGESLLAGQEALFPPQPEGADMTCRNLCQNRWPTILAGNRAMSAKSLNVLSSSYC